MNRSGVLFSLVGAVGLAGLLSACGSGGSPSASASAGGASGSGSASASGTVTGFGSVIVNGKRFETEGALLMVDGQQVPSCTVNQTTTCGLREGMIVNVSGTFTGSSHRASSIDQEDTLEGPITSKNQVDANNGTLTVLGQTVLVNETTKFDDSSASNKLDDLSVNDVVEVSGFVKNGTTGEIVASFIEKKAQTGCTLGCEVKGVIKSHVHNGATGSGTLQIGGLNVVYDNATLINDMPVPTGGNWNDRFVEVKGTSFDAVTTTLTATKVEPENDGVGNNADVDEFEVEGFVTQAGTPTGNIIDFIIGTTPVRTTANTEFRGGTVDEIVVGAKMSAEGRFDGSTLIAKHVKFHANVRLEGNATVSGNTLTLSGLTNLTVIINSQTEFKDATSLSDFDGTHVRVRGRVTGPNTVIATRIELRSADSDVDLQGPVQTINGDVIEILGVSIDTSTINHFESVSGASMNRTAFLAAVEVNSLVKVKGVLNGTTVTWDEAELED
ncbi:MAG: DUF5666 domain-containing protein [Nitrospira sp.]|nr:DUF5666 domain-containing protein [Nitrospira sp.]